MPESENPVQAFIQGGLPQLALGKHASEAIGQLVGGIVGVPVAWLDSYKQRINDETNARSTVKAAQAQAVAEMVMSDPGLVDRAKARWVGSETKKQKYREAVASVATEDLARDPSTAEEPVNPDFMSRFENYAEQAASVDMQALFGRVLAGEIRKPGAFSFTALHILSVMDQAAAEQIQLASSWVMNKRFLPKRGEFNTGERFALASRLTDLGLVRALDSQVTLQSGETAFLTADYAFLTNPSGVARLPVNFLTEAGVQIMELVRSPPLSDSDRNAICGALREALGPVKYGRCRRSAEGPDVTVEAWTEFH